MEYLETKTNITNMSVAEIPPTVAAAATTSQDNRIQSLETLVDKLCKKIDNISIENKRSTRNDTTCGVCNKKGHSTDRCFKTKTCFTCN